MLNSFLAGLFLGGAIWQYKLCGGLGGSMSLFWIGIIFAALNLLIAYIKHRRLKEVLKKVGINLNSL